jgi:hypothetical protein
VTQIFQNGQPSHCGDRKAFEVMASTQLIETLLAATLYQEYHDMNHKLWNIV